MDKGQRVANFHANTLKAVAHLLGTASLQHTQDFTPEHILRRNVQGQIETLAQQLFKLEPGVLNTPAATQALDTYTPSLGKLWLQANPAQWHV